MGRRTDEWERYRKQLAKERPPSHQGYHICHYGYKALEYLVFDHKDGRNGELLTDPDNIVKSCAFHNNLKGSMKYDQFKEYLEKNPKYRQCQF